MKPVARITLLLTVALSLLVAVPSAEAKAPRGFFGVIDFLPPNNLSQPARDDMYALMQNSGVESVRSLFYWANTETSKGVYNWTALDRAVGLSSSHGLTTLATVQGTPRWASTQPSRGDYATYPPKRLADYQDVHQGPDRPLRPQGHLLDGESHDPEAPHPRVADLERAVGQLLPERQELPRATTPRC